jgi:hypothetical protein
MRNDVTRVYESTGLCISSQDVTTKEGKFIPFSKWGCSYEDWLKGAKPYPMVDLECPMQFTRQMIQDKNHPAHKLFTDKCDKCVGAGGLITQCKNQLTKNECWDTYFALGGK